MYGNEDEDQGVVGLGDDEQIEEFVTCRDCGERFSQFAWTQSCCPNCDSTNVDW